MSVAPEPYKLYVLLAWHPPLGAPAYPVGVLAVSGTDFYTVWTAAAGDRAARWRARLSEPPAPRRIAYWLEQHGATQLAPAEPADPGTGIRQAADMLCERLETEIIPLLDPPDGP